MSSRIQLASICAAVSLAFFGQTCLAGAPASTKPSASASATQINTQKLMALMNQAITDNQKIDPYGIAINTEAIQQKKAADQAILKALGKVDRQVLSQRDKVFYDLFKWSLETKVAGEQLPLNWLPINHFNNFAVELAPKVASTYQINGSADDNAIYRVPDYFTGDGIVPIKNTNSKKLNGEAAKIDWYQNQQLPFLEAYANYLSQSEALFKEGNQHGITYPQQIINKVVEELKGALGPDGKSIKDSNAAIAQLKNHPKLQQSYRQIIQKINHNYVGLIQYLEKDYRARQEIAGENTLCQAGYCGMDDPSTSVHEGKEMYKWFLRKHTTSDLSPEQIHQMGIQEVNRIYSEMEKVCTTVGQCSSKPTQAQMKAFFKMLNGSEYRYANPYKVWTAKINPDTIKIQAYESQVKKPHDGKYSFSKAALDAINQEINQSKTLNPAQKNALKAHYFALYDYYQFKPKMAAQIPTIFGQDTIPNLDYQILPASYNEAPFAGVAWYHDGDPATKRPGTFYLNTYDPYEINNWSRSSLLSHEAAPGHHFQTTIAQELEEKDPHFPEFVKNANYNAYLEGWALYTEYLADHDLGMYQGKGVFDPKQGNPKIKGSQAYENQLQYFGRLNEEMLRAMRLVVDTGIHWYGWSHDKAVDYMKTHSALGDGDIGSEVPRYMAYAGQADSYKIGQLTIIQKRKDSGLGMPANDMTPAQRDRLKAYHHQVLEYGPLPMSVFEYKIDTWNQQK